MKSKIHDTSVSELAKQFKNQNLKSMSKKLLLSMAVVGMLFNACKKTEDHGHDHTEGTHQHADGAEHANHETDTVSQEEFTVGKDSAATKAAHDHQHDNGEKHDH